MTRIGVALALLLVLLSDPAAPAMGAEEPRGKLLLSRLFKDPEQFDMFLARPNGRKERLTRTSDVWELGGAFSPDGSQIVFVHERRRTKDRPQSFRLKVMDTDGDNVRTIAEGAYNSIEWSPDGTKITYQADEEDGRARLYFVDVASGDSTLLDEADYIDYELSWSPDSSQVVYSKRVPTEEDPYNHDVFVVTLENGETTQLTDTPGDDSSPDLSPDGSQIVFETTRDDEYSGPDSDGPYSSELYLMDADGANERALTDTGDTWDESPRWSPDGEWIVYERRYDDDLRTGRNADTDLLLISPDGERRALTDNSRRDEYDAIWSPDGRWVALEMEGGRTKSDVYIVRRSGRSLTAIMKTRRPDYVSDWGDTG